MLAELKRAEQAAEPAEDPGSLWGVLAGRGQSEPVFEGSAEDLLERAAALSRGLPLSSAVVTARQLAALARLHCGEGAEAARRVGGGRRAVGRDGAAHLGGGGGGGPADRGAAGRRRAGRDGTRPGRGTGVT